MLFRSDLELSLEDSGEVTARWLYKSKNNNPFSQINREVNDCLRTVIMAKIEEYFIAPGRGIDLFCGDGNLSLPLAEEGWRFQGLETSAEAIERGRKKISDLGKIDYLFQRVDLYSDVGRLLESLKKPDLLIADPPRGGLQGTISLILKVKPRVIFYISCNPPILAKEINLLRSDYILKEVIPFDMFPQTHHLETLAILLSCSED